MPVSSLRLSTQAGCCGSSFTGEEEEEEEEGGKEEKKGTSVQISSKRWTVLFAAGLGISPFSKASPLGKIVKSAMSSLDSELLEQISFVHWNVTCVVLAVIRLEAEVKKETKAR